MLNQRIYAPEDHDILYHYCSSSAFRSIIESGTLRFSDINMLNDVLEARWGYQIFIEAVNVLLESVTNDPSLDGLDVPFFDEVDGIFSQIQLHMHPFISCFSKEADQLSQWRAYADDGRGFSVGLKASILKYLPITLLDVQYDHNRQLDEMKLALKTLYTATRSGTLTISQRRQNSILLGCYSVAYKNPTFKEEREVRGLHLVDVEKSDGLIKLVDHGGLSDGKKVSGCEIKFRVQDAAIIPFFDQPIRSLFRRGLISEVVLGPKNVNGLGNVAYLLGKHGCKNVKIKASAIPYR